MDEDHPLQRLATDLFRLSAEIGMVKPLVNKDADVLPGLTIIQKKLTRLAVHINEKGAAEMPSFDQADLQPICAFMEAKAIPPPELTVPGASLQSAIMYVALATCRQALGHGKEAARIGIRVEGLQLYLGAVSSLLLMITQLLDKGLQQETY